MSENPVIDYNCQIMTEFAHYHGLNGWEVRVVDNTKGYGLFDERGNLVYSSQLAEAIFAKIAFTRIDYV